MDTLTETAATFTDKVEVGSRSSNINYLWHDRFTKRLYIEFHSGYHAAYSDFSETAWESLKNAQSVGKHYVRYIKGYYSGIAWPDNLINRIFRIQAEDAKVPVDLNEYKAKKSVSLTTFTIDVEVTEIKTVEVEATDAEDALRQAEKVGNPVRIAWDL